MRKLKISCLSVTINPKNIFLSFGIHLRGIWKFLNQEDRRKKNLKEYTIIFCYRSVCKLAIIFKELKTFRSFLITVSVIERNTANLKAPFVDLNCPDTFCLTFTFRIALSDALSKCCDNLAYPNFFLIPTSAANNTLS